MTLWNLNHGRCLEIKQHTRKRATFVHAFVNIARISRSTERWHACNNMSFFFFVAFFCFVLFCFFFLQEFVAIPSQSNATRKFQPPQRRRRNKVYSGESIGRPTSPRTSFLKPFFGLTVEKYTKFLKRIIQTWYFFKSTTIIVSMAKETIGIRPDDSISAYNGGKINFPWPTENFKFL